MKKPSPSGVRHYVYAWRGGPLIAKRLGGPKPILTTSELKTAIELLETNQPCSGSTLSGLISQWQSSPDWKGLAASTKRTWASQLRHIEARWGDVPLSVWNDPRMTSKVVKWRDDRSETPRGADLGVMVLRELLKFGRLRGRVSRNAAEGIPTLYRGGQRAEIVWTTEDIDRFADEAGRQDSPHILDGLRLSALTGLRREDLVTVRWQDVQEQAIVKRALKSSRGKRRMASMPRIPELNDLLAHLKSRPRQEGVDTLLVNSRGRAWSGDGFGGSFNRIRDAAQIEHIDSETGKRTAKRLHDVRGTFATKLILAGVSDSEVAEIMGWSVEQISGIRRTYVDQSRVIMAIGERIANASVNSAVNRTL